MSEFQHCPQCEWPQHCAEMSGCDVLGPPSDSTPSPDNLTRLRIYLRDGYYYDADLTVPWPEFIKNLVDSGYVAFNDAYFERALIGKIERFDPNRIEGASILKLVPKGNA